MNRTSLPRVFVLIASIAVLSACAEAQQAGPGITAASTTQATPSNVIAFSDSLPGQADGPITATFALYPDAQSTTPAWTETQVVQVTQGKYTVLLGAATTNGVPSDIFAADQAHWLGVQINGAEKRYLLVSVPFAMKAMEAERLGGLLPSQFVTTAQLQAALQASATSGSSTTTSSGTKATSGPVANASLNPPEPATDFTDNTTTEVLLVTQQGTGFAIHAISAGDAALFGENSTQTGTAVKAVASSTSGTNIGLLAQSASPNGIAGVFDNTGNGQILSLRNNGNEVASVDNAGDFRGNIVNANGFNGNGGGLFGISNSATTANTAGVPNTIVLRDNGGGISANSVIANFFSGSGGGLFNIPNSATSATSANTPNTIVARDNSGNFTANNIQASGLTMAGGSLFNFGFTDLSGGTTAPVHAVLSANAPTSCLASKELLIETDAFPGQQLFICNANGTGWILLGDGSGSGTVSGNTTGPLESIAQLGSGAGVTISSTSGTGLNSSSVNGTGLSSSSSNGTGIQGNGGSFGIQASSQRIGLWAATQANDSTGTSLLLTNAGSGKLISAGQGSFAFLPFETFGVDTFGNVDFNGALMAPYQPTGSWVPNTLVKLTSSSGTFASATVTTTSPGDTSGAIGIITGTSNGIDGFVLVAQGGRQSCVFDGVSQMGDYVGISQLQPGECTDLGPNYPSNGVQVVGRVTIGGTVGTVLLFGPEQHAGSGGNFSLTAADPSVAIGGTTSAPTIEVANGGITSAKLAPNAVNSANLAPNSVTSANIADGSLLPAKITGTAATLGANNFTGTQTMPVVNAGSLTVSGNITGTGGGSISGSTFINTAAGTALSVFGGDATNPGFTATNPANGGIALEGTSLGSNAIGVLGRANGGQSVAGLFVNTQGNGRIISAGTGSGTFGSEVFSVDTAGNVFNGGSLVASFPGSITNNTLSGLAKLDANGFAVSTTPADTSGAVGVVLPLGGSTSSVRIAYGGTAFCVFDSAPHIGNYVQISRTTTGGCSDVGPTYPSSGQVIGRVTGVSFGAGGFVLLSGPSTQSVKAGIGTINTGGGLTGGPITSSGTISIANGGVTNAMLQNSSVIVSPGLGLSGGGTVPLGGSITLNNTGALSFNGRTGSILSAPGDYSFGQIAGTASSTQLPSSLVYNNQSNTFAADQTINGALTTNTLTTGTLTATSLNVPLLSVSGNSTNAQSVISAFDTAATGGFGAFSASSQNNAAGFFTSSGTTILAVGTPTHGVLVVGSQGVSVTGTASATAFIGDGSGLTNVNASSIGGTNLANLATTSALNAETLARQSGDATLQNNINNEAGTRQATDTFLQTTISAETLARQNADSSLLTNIVNVSAADAKLATANTFTASNTFTGGTQDFSAAGATLPVRALPSAQTPATCVASKELLIKTDAPAGQQLFVCDAGGTTWNLVGDGASGGVTSFNGRNGPVSPGSGDYSFGQISGSLAASQLPALTGDVTEAAGSGFTLLTTTGVTPGSYSKVSVDLKGRVTLGSQAAFSDITGFVAQNQLPVNVVYNNQVNTFSQSQNVNGNLVATFFTGNGGGLTNVNATTFNNLPPTSFAQLGATSNAFTGGVSAPSFSGDGSALTNVNAATVNNLQMLKLSATITPANVANQSCTEQSFTVSGVNSGDVLLSVQPSGHSPGTNIAIGGWRVSAANTVAIQFCNVSRSNSTPTAGTYTIAVMR